jgi:hypothetical protein
LATYRTVPYGIYDVNKNIGYVFVGISNDTPEFAVDAIVRWWREEGSIVYGGAKELLILADSGGSNSFHTRAWRYQLQVALCDAFDLAVTVCHYPPGCSKWVSGSTRVKTYGSAVHPVFQTLVDMSPCQRS